MFVETLASQHVSGAPSSQPTCWRYVMSHCKVTTPISALPLALREGTILIECPQAKVFLGKGVSVMVGLGVLGGRMTCTHINPDG